MYSKDSMFLGCVRSKLFTIIIICYYWLGHYNFVYGKILFLELMTISRFIIFIKSIFFLIWKIVCNFCNRYGILEISTIICGRCNIFVKYNILDWCQQHFVTPSSCCDLTRSRKSRGFFSPIIVDTTLVGLALLLQHAELTRLACLLQWPFEGPYEPCRMACTDIQNKARLVLHRVQRFRKPKVSDPKGINAAMLLWPSPACINEFFLLSSCVGYFTLPG